MYVLRTHLHVLDWRGWQDAVTEIEDVTGTVGDASEHTVCLLQHTRRRAEQQRGIEIPLHTAIGADACPGLVDRDAPVHADHVAARFTQLFEDRCRSRTEVNRRDPLRDCADNMTDVG